MWRTLFLTAAIYIFSVSSRAVDPLEGPLWSSRIDDLASQQDLRNMQSELFKQRKPSRNIYNTDADYNIILLRPPNDKRALAMFARWGPINKLGKERSPPRNSLIPEGSIITQTRGRMLGQPLRWG